MKWRQQSVGVRRSSLRRRQRRELRAAVGKGEKWQPLLMLAVRACERGAGKWTRHCTVQFLNYSNNFQFDSDLNLSKNGLLLLENF
jgi:hypothetical protein